jgi:hypothetical protein
VTRIATACRTVACIKLKRSPYIFLDQTKRTATPKGNTMPPKMTTLSRATVLTLIGVGLATPVGAETTAPSAGATHTPPHVHIATPADLSVSRIEEIVLIDATNDGQVSHHARANSPDGKATRKVVVTSSGGEHIEQFRFPAMPSGGEIDVMVSNAISSAFSSANGLAVALGGRQVKNAPYAAEVINERVQTLPDGNQIVKRTSHMTHRDSAGRTRTESKNEAGELRSINIFDPLDSKRVVLIPSRKTAMRTDLKAEPVGDMSKRLEEMRERIKSMPREPRGAVEEVVIRRSGSAGGAGSEGGAEGIAEIRIGTAKGSIDPASGQQLTKRCSITMTVDGKTTSSNDCDANVLSGTANLGAGLAPLPGELSRLAPIATSMTDRKWAANSTTRELGTRDFDGVRAEGKVRSYTIPANEIGNRNAITVATETWYSPDLQVTVYSKHSDPRSGDVVYRLANIKRSEQPIGLFNVPDGYKVTESSGFAYSYSTKSK